MLISLRGGASRFARFIRICTALAVAVAVSAALPTLAHADTPPVGTVAGGVTFSQDCSSGIGVGITYDGSSLWYSCYDSSPDLLRADPRTGQVTAS